MKVGANLASLVLALAVGAGLTAQPALGYWSDVAEGGAAGGAAAAALEAGAAPTVNSAGSAGAVVSWASRGLTNGVPADGYLVRRYDATTGVEATIGGGCAGTIAATTCTEPEVPAGSWEYSVTPVFGSDWRGEESPHSGVVTLGSASLSLSTSVFGGAAAPLPATAVGTVSGFGPEEEIEFFLDGAMPLPGSPARVGADGAAAIETTIPSGTGEGPQTLSVRAAGAEASAGIVVEAAPAMQPAAAPASAGAEWSETDFAVPGDEADLGGSVEATGLTGTGGRYSTSRTLNLVLGPGSDAGGTGLAIGGAQLLRAIASLSSDGVADGTCGSFGTYSQVGGDDPPALTTDTVPADRACYRYEYVVPDGAGSRATYTSAEIKVDAADPPAPALSFSALDGAYWSGTGTTVYYRPGVSGGFQLSASARDTTAGTAAYAFPTLPAGWSASPEGRGLQRYRWGPDPESPGDDLSVTATSNAGAGAATGFTLVADDAAPSGGSIAYPTGTLDSAAVPITVVAGSDSGAGIATATVERDSAVLDPSTGACEGFPGTYATAVTLVDGADLSVAPGHCYRYRYVVTDAVGNEAVYSSPGVAEISAG